MDVSHPSSREDIIGAMAAAQAFGDLTRRDRRARRRRRLAFVALALTIIAAAAYAFSAIAEPSVSERCHEQGRRALSYPSENGRYVVCGERIPVDVPSVRELDRGHRVFFPGGDR